MDRPVIGMDPHKRSVTIEARDVREVLRAVGVGSVRRLASAGWQARCGLAVVDRGSPELSDSGTSGSS
jgi:hypothetical protein